MSDTIVERDIYDKNGVLLLAKGKKTTESIIEKLRRRGYYVYESLAENDEEHNAATFARVLKLRKKIKSRYVSLLDYSNEILSQIIFESKKKPSWMFANALCNYVDWIYTHSIDVALISLMIAAEIGYAKDDLKKIGLGAFLHDIGMVLIPKSILQKDTQLNDMEKVYFRQHCDLGISSIAPFDLPRECLDIILQHHERLDGSGYPKGLKGEQICQNAKIVMIADVLDINVDANIAASDKPYRPYQDVNEAIKTLRDDGNKYSLDLVFVLEKMLLS